MCSRAASLNHSLCWDLRADADLATQRALKQGRRTSLRILLDFPSSPWIERRTVPKSQYELRFAACYLCMCLACSGAEAFPVSLEASLRNRPEHVPREMPWLLAANSRSQLDPLWHEGGVTLSRWTGFPVAVLEWRLLA